MRLVRPATNFDAIPELARWAVMMGMLLGRPELATFYVVPMPFFWRHQPGTY
jgi:trk system potassium uptake protein